MNQNNFNINENNELFKNNQDINNSLNQNLQSSENTYSTFQNNQTTSNNSNQLESQTNIAQTTTFTYENNTNNTFNNKPPKKMNLWLILGIIAVILIIAVFVIVISLNKKNDTTKENNNENQINNNISNGNAEKCEGTNIVLNGLKGSTVSYYYNIDTSKFDKSKFNGEINFFGITINGKITTNKLKSAGVTIKDVSSLYNIVGQTKYYNETGKWYFGTAEFSIDTSSDITNSDIPVTENPFGELELIDYTGGQELYSDTTLVTPYGSYVSNLSSRNIYPKQLEINNYSEITIDLLLEKLGNPTFVERRESSCLESKYSYTVYLYVYDDVAFSFMFYNWENLKLAGMNYHPIEVIKSKASQDATYVHNETEYDNIWDMWVAYEKTYQNSIKK